MFEEIFSPQELKVIKGIGRKTTTIRIVVESMYRSYTLERANYVGGSIRRINAKCKRHKLSWFINGAGGGRGGKLVWKDKL